MATSSSVPDNGGDHSGGGGEPEGTYTDDVFSTYLYDGRNGPFRIRNGVDLDGEGGLVWIKCRNQSVTHQLVDTERGQSSYLASQSGNQEIIDADSRVTYFNNDGFSLGTGGEVNNATRTYASWTFGKAKKFFDIVTYTGDGVAGREIPHNLGVKPGMVIVKKTNAPSDWPVWHRDLGEANSGSTHSLTLNDSNSQAGRAEFATTQTATHIVIGSTPGGINANGDEYVAYLFAHDETDSGQIQCGSYTGTNAAGNAIDLGWEPQWVMIKGADDPSSWWISDSTRGITSGHGVKHPALRANDASEELSQDILTLTPTGFEAGDYSQVNGINSKYIYMAIRKPNKPRPPVGYYVDDVFSTYLYEGDQSSPSRAIVNGIDLDGEGGMVWIKERSQNRSHCLYDTERGAGAHLETDRNQPESAFSNGNLQSFNSDGFTLGDFYGISETGEDFVSWTFRKAPNLLDIVRYTGTSPSTQEVPHNLGAKPGMIIVKSTSDAWDWAVWHNIFGDEAKYLQLNKTEPAVPSTGNFPVPPTDEVFSVGTASNTNGAGMEYVAYVFAHDDHEDGYIQCGSFTGTTEVDLGWEPQFILTKVASASGNWELFDTMRGIATGSDKDVLRPNLADAESNGNDPFDVTATGFNVHNPFALEGGSGTTEFIYMAIRRPNKPAEEFEPEELFDIAYADGSGSPDFKGPLTDFRLFKDVTSSNSVLAGSRLQGTKYLKTAESEGESNASYSKYDYMDGWGSLGLIAPNMSWMWRRAPGFFDVVAYEGDGQGGRRIPHSLGAEPEMMWIKNRATNTNWAVYSKTVPTGVLNLDGNYPVNLSTQSWDNDTPTSEVFPVAPLDNWLTNDSGKDYIAYLFASVPGICDIGSYTGNGGVNKIIDCGFTNGARFVLIKRTDAAGDWAVFDVARGITNSDSPYIKLNTTEAQVTGSYIAPLSVADDYVGGFKLVSADPNINASQGTYIYIAIA
jgi:hypothetical protein